MNTRIYWLHTLSPTHVGTGRGAGYIDLPIHRDKITGWPLVPGSSFKGVWADHFRATDDNRRTDPKLGLAFGRASDRESNASNAGALVPTDARIVCLPIRSYFGTFAWCTSPLALQLLHRDLSLAGVKELPKAPSALNEEHVHRTTSTKLEDGGRVYFEDLDFTGRECKVATAWAERLAAWVFPEEGDPWRARFIERFAVVPDAVFDFLTETGTEVSTRVRIDDATKTVSGGQLWNEESLPAETILVGLIGCDRPYDRQQTGITSEGLIQKFATDPLLLQIGGKATIGRGRVRCVFTSPNDEVG